jgi:ferritin-like protein
MSSEDLHVARERLSDEARLMHYAITSLKEELDAVDWYRQRADDTEDAELREVLLHNMREEMEHASMILEWLRRRNKDFAGYLKTYLFTEAPLTEVEDAAEHGGNAKSAKGRDGGDGLTIGSMVKR